jgi:predicted transcriptional regulator
MIRGTTPKLEFILPFDTSLIAEMYVTIAQGEKTVLEKTLSDCSCSGTSVSLTLTQEDTLRLQQQPHSRAEMQIRVRTTAGEALASDIMRVYVGRILKEGVI